MARSERIDLDFIHLIDTHISSLVLVFLDKYYKVIIMQKQLLSELIPHILLFILN